MLYGAEYLVGAQQQLARDDADAFRRTHRTRARRQRHHPVRAARTFWAMHARHAT